MELNADRGCWDCPYCGSEWAPQTNFEGVRVVQPSTSECPLCKPVKLAQARIFEFGLLYCEGCQGMLIEMGDLVPLTSDLRASRGAPAFIGRPPDPKESGPPPGLSAVRPDHGHASVLRSRQHCSGYLRAVRSTLAGSR